MSGTHGDLAGAPPPGIAQDAVLAGKRALVLGLGRFGGGVETARYLKRIGARCRISDSATRDELAGPAREAERHGAQVVFGPQTPALLEDTDFVIVGPAIPTHHPVITEATARGIPVTTEINLFLRRCQAPVFAVTGTKGKSTTSTLLANMLGMGPTRVRLGGNIGRPLIGEVQDIGPRNHIVVLELSSFQLWWAARMERLPELALLTNLFPDHLDRHGTMAAYVAAKRVLFDGRTDSFTAVLPSDPGPHAAGFGSDPGADVFRFGAGGALWIEDDCIVGHDPAGSARRIRLDGLRLLGAHNRQNTLAAAAAAVHLVGLRDAAIEAGIAATEPLPHRLQTVGEVDGVQYVDDSNATNPRSTTHALEAFDAPVILLLGGKDKGVDPGPLLEAVAARAKAVVGIGTTGPALAEALTGRIEARTAADMAAAVRTARELAVAGDVVLLSPAYSSLDQYPSFAIRGDAFQAAVHELRGIQ